MTRRVSPWWGGAMLMVVLLPGTARAAVWEADFSVGFADIYAQLDDTRDPVSLLLRIGNQSQTEAFSLGPDKTTDLLYMRFDGQFYNFEGDLRSYSYRKRTSRINADLVLLMDKEDQRMQSVSADEIVGEIIQELHQRLPRHAREIDRLLGGIQSDYAQEKIVEVYARLKNYMQSGRPLRLQSQVENFLLGRPEASETDCRAAEEMIESIGRISQNYLWPRALAPGEVVTGLVYFKRPVKVPPRLFVRTSEEEATFLGREMKQVSGDRPRPTDGP